MGRGSHAQMPGMPCSHLGTSRFHLDHRALTFPRELPLQPPCPESSEPGFGDRGGGPSEADP